MPDRSAESTHVYNKQHQDDIRYTMQFCRWVMKPIGAWHFVHSRSTRQDKLLSAVLIFLCSLVMLSVLVPTVPFVLVGEKDLYKKVKLFGPVGFCVSSTIKYCLLGIRGAAIGTCIEHVENDWRIVRYADHRKLMLKNARISRRVTVLCVLFLYTGGLSYHTIVPIANAATINGTRIRPLAYPGYDDYFDPQATPAYEILFVLHCLCSIIQFTITSAAFSLGAIFATHACAQAQILTLLLYDFVDGKRDDEYNTVEKRLKFLTRHHVRVLRFTADVEEVLREICLLELMTATSIICLLEYYCMVEWANSDAIAIITYFILLVALTFNIAIFCYIGELLMQEFSKIASAAYEANWYDLPGHKAIGLVMIIVISYNPPKLTAGKFFDLSLETFSAVLRTTLVYLNLLRTVTE